MTAKRIGKFYVLLNGINDFAYFGFLAIQFLLVKNLIRQSSADQTTISDWLSITIIASQLLWQSFAEGPTGALADLRGRAWAIATSFWCRFVAIVLVIACVILKLNFESQISARLVIVIILILAQILMATGEAFLEGSIEAWLRDECKIADPDNHDKIRDKAFEHSAIVQNVSILVSGITFLAIFDDKLVRGIPLSIVAACLCFIGALISRNLSGQEKFIRNPHKSSQPPKVSPSKIRPTVKAIILKIRDAFTLIAKSDVPVRRLITILILPFPSWIMVSWFFPSFADSSGINRLGSANNALWLGAVLGVTRVLGALIGKKQTSESITDKKYLRLVFEKAVFINIFFLFGAALLLVLNNLYISIFFPMIGTILFLITIGVAKGSEEVIKLSKNKILAEVVPDDDIRATTLSMVSVAQNTCGFVVIFLSSIFASIIAPKSWYAILIFAVCALLGIVGWLVYQRVASLPIHQT